MKKLMIAAAAAAMVSGAFAVEAQVYDYTATLKTTGCKAGKVNAKLLNYFEHSSSLPSLDSVWNGSFDRGDEVALRKQGSVKIAGVIWGCDCLSIIGTGSFYLTPRGYLAGYLFWNQKTRTVYNPWNSRTTFQWNTFNRIDAMDKVEGSYKLVCTQAGQQIWILGSGFGSAKGTGCDAYVNSMSGNLAGVRFAPREEFGCAFCASQNNCVTAPFCDLCVEDLAYGWPTISAWQPNNTVVSGTWKIKYNKSASRRLSSTPFISRVYTFKNGGNAALHAEVLDRVNASAQGKNYGADIECSDLLDDDACEVVEEYYGDIDEAIADITAEDVEELGTKYSVVAEDLAEWENDEDDELGVEDFDTAVAIITGCSDVS